MNTRKLLEVSSLTFQSLVHNRVSIGNCWEDMDKARWSNELRGHINDPSGTAELQDRSGHPQCAILLLLVLVANEQENRKSSLYSSENLKFMTNKCPMLFEVCLFKAKNFFNQLPSVIHSNTVNMRSNLRSWIQ